MRVLTGQLGLPRHIRACEPEVKILTFGKDLNVAYDCNAGIALQLTDEEAARAAARDGQFRGLLYSGIAPCFPLFSPTGAAFLVLNVTHACNLACRYCFAREHYPEPKTMSQETAVAALGLFASDAPIRLSFFGGEPLLAWDTLIAAAESAVLLAAQRAEILAKAAPRKAPVQLHITTNGTLLDAHKAAALARLGFSVLLSLDGPRELHDAARPMKAKDQSSFDATMAGLHALNAVGIKPTLRGTFTGDDMRLLERLQFAARLYDEGKIQGASIEPAQLSESCAAQLGIAPSPTMRVEWHAAAEWFVARVKGGKPFPYFFYVKKLQRLLQGRLAGSDCGAGKGYLTVGPEGDIFACHREFGTRIGSLAGGFDAALRAQWHDNTLTHHADCQACWARYACGGGCHQERFEIGGDMHAHVESMCELRRWHVEEGLWILTQLTREQAFAAAGIRPAPKPCAGVCA